MTGPAGDKWSMAGSRAPSAGSVVLAGGGTGGHIEPAMNLADELRRRDPDRQIVALGTAKGLEMTIVPKRGYPLELIPPVPLPRKPSKEWVTLPGRVRAAVKETKSILTKADARVVVGFGGYVSLPAYLAARRLGVPIVVHEANAKPGLANRIGSRMTNHVAEMYAGSLRGATRIGCPLRKQIADLDRMAARAEARAFFGLDPDRATLFAFGGSQGAQRINMAVQEALPMLADSGVQVLHAVGAANIDKVDTSLAHYHPVAFVDRMDLAYAAADIGLCRSGAMTCAEVAAVGLPAIYIPYPIGNGEQRLNAAPVVDAGGGLVISDEDLTGALLAQTVIPLLADQEKLAVMSRRSSSYGIPDAAQRLADMSLTAAGWPT